MGFTNEERDLLDKLNSGMLDGRVGDVYYVGNSSVWKEIVDGVPTEYKKGPGGKFFNGKENEGYEGVLHVKKRWKSDKDKINFLRKYGFLMLDSAVRSYSGKFKPE